jgi:cytoskeletal protein CcmA (bactofilin family)
MADKQSADGELSFVGASTVIEGKIKTDGSIRIDGKLIGELVAKANAAIGINGTVEGSLTARNVSLAGKVNGTITATDKLILEGKSVMKGDVRAARLVVDEGAMFDGQCDMTSSTGTTKQGWQRDQ